MLLKLGYFQYDMLLDLNIGYYHIQLNSDASNLCTTIQPWETYHYKFLPMGIRKSPDILQQKMSNLFQVFKVIRVHIDEIFILSKRYWIYHVQKFELTLNKLKEGELTYNIEKSFFGNPKWNT